jgi:hypothetical protein
MYVQATPTMSTGSILSDHSHTIGNVGHCIAVASIALYAVAQLPATPWSAAARASLFDPAWGRYGFCINYPDRPYWNSHVVCFYVDTVMTVVLAIISYFCIYRGRTKTGDTVSQDSVEAIRKSYIDRILTDNIPGLFFHGVAHLDIGSKFYKEEYEAWYVSWQPTTGATTSGMKSNWSMLLVLNSNSSIGFWASLIGIFIFYAAFLSSAFAAYSRTIVAVVIVLAWVGHLWVPYMLGFAYVQTVLLLAFSFRELTLPKNIKRNNAAYAIHPWIMTIPLSAVSWIESTQCSAFVRDYLYGHAFYDAFIPLSVIVWYLFLYHGCNFKTASNEKMKHL